MLPGGPRERFRLAATFHEAASRISTPQVGAQAHPGPGWGGGKRSGAGPGAVGSGSSECGRCVGLGERGRESCGQRPSLGARLGSPFSLEGVR